MATPSDLVTSGLLHEGNFLTWKPRILVVLRIHGWDTEVDCDCDNDLVVRPCRACKKAIGVIEAHVSPQIWSQVSPPEDSHLLTLLNRLESASLRFWFLDLPPELRNRVYQYLLADSPRSRKIYYPMKIKNKYPPVSKSSRRIRNEFMPLFYSQTKFSLRFTGPAPRDVRTVASPQRLEYSKEWQRKEGDINAAEEVKKWAAQVSSAYVKHLRSVSLTIKTKAGSKRLSVATIHFKFCKEDALGDFGLRDLDAASAKTIRDHVAAVESTRKLLGLQGEAILLAIISKPELWKYRNFTSK